MVVLSSLLNIVFLTFGALPELLREEVARHSSTFTGERILRPRPQLWVLVPPGMWAHRGQELDPWQSVSPDTRMHKNKCSMD